MKQYKLAFVIGRFQPFHNQHKACIDKALEIADHVIVFVGSTNCPRTPSNPFSYDERFHIIWETYKDQDKIWDRLSFYPLSDYLDDNKKWKNQIDGEVSKYKTLGYPVAIVGGSKGEWYYEMFKEYDHITLDIIIPLNATDLRESYFQQYTLDADKYLYPLVPRPTYDFLVKHRYSNWYRYVVGWYGMIKDLNSKYGKGPFLTCDNVIIHNEDILLIKRKNHPGRGLWAIPGGYFDMSDKSWKEGCYRELVEETGLNISYDFFNDCLVDTEIFDKPNRSTVARLMTLACCVQLPGDIDRSVIGNDDAVEAKWFNIREVLKMHHLMFDDHYYLVKYFTKNFCE